MTRLNGLRITLQALCIILTISGFGQSVLEQEFHGNGRLKSTYFSDGTSVHFMTYYESGRLHEMGSFRNGLRDGVWKQYAENGAILARATFVEGSREGTWEFRDPNNALKVKLEYQGGALARGEQYGDGGELVAQRSY